MALIPRFRRLLGKTVRSARNMRDAAVAPREYPASELPEVEPGTITEEIVFDIRSSTVIRIALLVLLVVTGFSLVRELLDVLLLILFSVIITAALQPFVDRMEARGYARGLIAFLVFFAVVALMTTLIVILLPLVAEQVLDLATNVTNIVEQLFREGPQTLPLIGPRIARLTENVDPAVLAAQLQEPLQELGRTLLGKSVNAVGAAGSIAIGIFDSLAVLIISFYMVIRRSNVDGIVRLVTPKPYEEYAVDRARVVVSRMGAWLRAQFLVMLFVFVLSFIGFGVIGLPYALFLAILAGIFSIVPVVGWITAGILAILLALTQSTWVVVGALVVVAIVHFADSYVFVPLVTERAVGLSPVAVIIALLVGFKIAGLLGVLVAVPVATAIATILSSPHPPRHTDDRRPARS